MSRTTTVRNTKDGELPNKAEQALQLLKLEWSWARSANPSQPLASGVWKDDWSEGKLSEMVRLQLENSDVITFHCYDPPDVMKRQI
jgi:hypothetical protein